MNIVDYIKKIKIVPVVVVDDFSKTDNLAKALVNSKLEIAEVTFRSQCAKDVIEKISKDYPSIVVGAGTILNVEQAKIAIEKGAKFIVTPGFSKDVCKYCIENNVLVIPGCVTPSEIMQALDLGINIIKFFPCSNFGGLSTIKALSAPFKDVYFMPTGGINQDNVKQYLEFNKIIACGGSWMVNSKLINEDKFDEIEKLCKEALELIK